MSKVDVIENELQKNQRDARRILESWCVSQ